MCIFHFLEYFLIELNYHRNNQGPFASNEMIILPLTGAVEAQLHRDNGILTNWMDSKPIGWQVG